jgi:XRE family transcriptional regulator, regulator of sulfur utilization
MVKTTLPDIGRKIKQIRSSLHLTLDQLAAKSGVSKSMLSQIERNLTNPTVGILWSLTQALNIDLAELLESKTTKKKSNQNITTVKSHETPEIQSIDGKCRLKILGPLNLVSRIEWYDLEIKKGGILNSEPHQACTQEHLTILEGSMIVSTGSDKRIFIEGDTARYNADVAHSIKNNDQKTARAILIVYTPI